jgi:hypothetical protein
MKTNCPPIAMVAIVIECWAMYLMLAGESLLSIILALGGLALATATVNPR